MISSAGAHIARFQWTRALLLRHPSKASFFSPSNPFRIPTQSAVPTNTFRAVGAQFSSETTSPGVDENDSGRPFQITTPIYYVNDKPHIGHAYTSTACDVIARFMRLSGRDVFFLTGTDEHGQKVEQSAEKKGLAPKDFVDSVSTNFRDLSRQLNISNDKFIRTTDEEHKQAVQ
eukprot:scaffold197_cov129-Cylindrotheca_fusiformis.AAC.5